MNDILENGYSKFSQEVIKNENLDIKAKAIYLFLCAYKNVDNIATPKRETIMNYLGIGAKDTYYKYLKELEALGYIKVSVLKVDGKIFCNQYTIVQKIGDRDLFKKHSIIPKKIMNDKNIPIEAKVIYGYMCIYRNKESNDIVYPNISQLRSHLAIGENRLNKGIRTLIEEGYIRKEQYKNKQKFSSNVYKLEGYRENITTKDSKLSEEEITESTQKEIELRDLKNKTYKQVIETENKVQREIRAFEETIKDNLEFNNIEKENEKVENISMKNGHSTTAFLRNYLEIDEDLYNFTRDTVNIIVRTIFSENEFIKIEQVEYPKILVKEMFLKLRQEHIREILDRYRKATENSFIKNPSKYLETILYSVCFDYGLVQIRNKCS